MKARLFFAAVIVLAATVTSCKKENDILVAPTVTNLEIGTGNNKQGIIGKDFHLNADVVAGDKIDLVKVIISSAAWRFEVTWDIYSGAKNTNVHKHFTIPADAIAGDYDFTLLITDQNGQELRITEDFKILSEDDLPVNPVFNTRTVPTDNQVFKKGETITARFSVENVRDSGTLCAILVKASSNHLPETVSAIDYSKAIVIGKYSGTESPSWGMYSTIVVDGEWESGKYYFIMLYQNITHNISIYKHIPVTINQE